MPKKLGAIYTPEGYARILTTWAIQKRTDIVLDMGVGPGIFVYQSFNRLIKLGGQKNKAVNQIYGSEIDKKIFDKFTKNAKDQGLEFKNLQNANFFNISIPKLDAIVGNPPYVRRRGMSKTNLKLMRETTLKNNSNLDQTQLSNLSDLYIYFLLSALPALKPGGRLATIIADSWLNTRYGVTLKEYLLKEFEIHQIVSLDRSVFNDAQVKAVLLLASKKNSNEEKQYSIKFARVKNGLSMRHLSSFVLRGETQLPEDIMIKKVKRAEITSKIAWGAILKSTTVFDEIKNKPLIKPINEIADTQIGLETLAKDFFVISENEKNIVEKMYLKPFAYSVYDFKLPIIKKDDQPAEYLFCCSKSKNSLKNTKAYKYISKGEKIKVGVKGTNKIVTGYHKKERIKKARRPKWYDVKTECDKKRIAEILLPRFIYKDYRVLWNRARYIPGGAVVQFFPKDNTSLIETRVYLAILNSSFTEIAFRINAQVYGGGTSNLRVSAIRESPTIDVLQLSAEQKKSLASAYNKYLEINDKQEIDKTVYEILKLTENQKTQMNSLLLELRQIAESSKQAAHPAEE